jgi:uncharacterized protein (DUF488 family)
MPPEDDIFTVGHSVHELDEFVGLLRRFSIGLLVDVRQYPRSRRVPQFNAEALEHSLPGFGIEYVHMRELGGRRRPRPDSSNGGWENEQFRGYADYMETEEFAAALSRLESLARERPTAIMCAEAQWWRCHRRLVSDALLVRGWRVRHLWPDGRVDDHSLTAFAVVVDGRLSYPPEQTSLGL